MKKLLLSVVVLFSSLALVAQQLPDPSFEDWSGSQFDGNAQPKYWHFSNITQFGFKFNYAHREAGHTGSYSMRVQDQDVGAMGITETSPGYVSLGQPWQYVESVAKISQATGGDDGGINFAYRPDTMAVWIKRTGNNTSRENFTLLFYSWSGTAKGNSYAGKGGGCTSTSHTDEESDIRLSTDANACGTTQKAQQIAEGLYFEKKSYGSWTQIKVPICYMSNDAPQKCNVIFASAGYPNFRSQNDLYSDNSLYVDDVQLIYSSRIQKLFIDGVAWNGFNPNTEEEQVYSLGEKATAIPDIYATRGAGTITNMRGQSVAFAGRKLQDSEIQIVKGKVGEVTTITVKAEDGSSTTTYRIRFTRAASTNTQLAQLWTKTSDNDSTQVANFNPYAAALEVELPYGTTTPPVLSVVTAESQQKVSIKQAASLSDQAVITVTAADGIHTRTYTITFKVGQLADNSLKDILVNGVSVAGFMPSQTIYRVSLPLGTTAMPEVKAVSAYPAGEQTIEYQAPDKIEGGVYQIKVTTPGNTTPRIYKLNFRLEASTFSLLKDLTLGGTSIEGFSQDIFTYYVTLPIGTTAIPQIGYEQGDPYQTVTITPSDVNGTSLVTVKAASGATSVYKIIFSTPLSENSLLAAIYINGELIDGFTPNTRVYPISLPIGTTDADFPEITWQTMDEYETVDISTNGVNGITRITVTAGNGTTTQYQLQFKVQQDEVSSLSMIYIDGQPLAGFDPETLEYTFQLSADAVSLPVVTFDKGSPYQTVTPRSPNGLTGDYTLSVRPQSGVTRKYTIRFTQQQSSNALLGMIMLDGSNLEDFDANAFFYTHTLPAGISTLPEVTFTKQEDVQKVVNLREGFKQTLTVTAQDGTVAVYTITFIQQKSESAFLNMIYLDGEPLSGFDKNTLSYTHTLLTPTCPTVSVQRADSAQRVAVTTPYGAGQAKILVTPESGSPNVYTIDFVEAMPTSVLLNGILVDGTPISTFEPTTFSYTLPMGTELPVVVPVTAEGQTVQVLSKDNTVSIYVQSGSLHTCYTLTFTHTPSADTHLQSVLLDGTAYSDFESDAHDYTVSLPEGSAIPAVDYIAGSELQTISAGFVSSTVYRINVLAEDKTSQAVYTLTFAVEPYSDSRLKNIIVEGKDLTYSENTYDYYLTHDAGQDLPELSVVAKEGQTTMIHNVSDSVQEVHVLAQSGARALYTIHYKRTYSNNALLQDILIGKTSLPDFSADKTEYTVTLPWRTTVLPSVQPVGMLSTQTITTYHGTINTTTHIHVVAPDGVATQDYYIHFPVVKSDNTALNDLYLLSDDYDLGGFSQDKTEYKVLLPFGTKQAPAIRFEKAEPEQTVRQIIRPVGQVSEIIVTAENGDSRTYSITFEADTPHKPNRLIAISIVETNEALDLTNTDTRDFTVNLPYGIRSMTVRYEKTYDEQTVVVAAGGITAPTQIIVKANVDTVPDEVYTLTPVIPTADPAVLTDLQVNNVTIPGFDPERFSYIVPVTSAPVVRAVAAEGATANPLIQTNKHYQIEVTYKGRVNTYDLWYYYTGDVVPNGEFSDWTTAKNNNAAKPVGWSVIADADDRYLTYRSGPECSQSSSGVVRLLTEYRTICARSVPGFMTLGSITGELSSTNVFNYNGSITFRNTPDWLYINYKAPEIQKHNRIVYELWGSTGYDKIEHNDESSFNDFRTLTLDLSGVNNAVGDPNAMNIFLNSNYQETGNLGTDGGFGTHGEMHIDWIRLGYNSRLTGLSVNGVTATLTDNAFDVTLKTPENIEIPQLQFAGEVADQARQIVWTDETKDGEYGVRTASIRNYAENGTDFTDYSLTVRRLLSTENTLDSIYINGTRYHSFTANTTDYTIRLTSADRLPDLQAFPASSRQTLTTTYTATEAVITVTPEYGDPLVYTIHFVVDKSDDTSLAFITELDDFRPELTDYTFVGDSMPDFFFTTAHYLQTVDAYNGRLTVTAEDGSQGVYTVTLLPRSTSTTAQLSEIELDGTLWADFRPDTYTYTREAPDTIVYTKASVNDSLVFIQSPTALTWNVFGTPEENTHTYIINYPTNFSDNSQLAGIYINGTLIEGFDAGITEYALPSDTCVSLRVLQQQIGQHIDITEQDSVYTIVVTAEDGVKQTIYRLALAPDLSDNAYLDMITLDGINLIGFRPDSLSYVVTLPSPEVKTAEPKIPTLSYILGQNEQQVELQAGNLGEPSYIIVTAETGRTTTYDITVEAEPSHNADITGIVVNGVPMERFEVGRHYYSTWAPADEIDINWTTDDNFQTITLSHTDYTYNIHVVAQDGYTEQDYQVEIFVESVPDDARLKDILIDGTSLGDFERALNPKLKFDPDNNTYIVNLPSNVTALPQVYAMLKMDGQKADIATEDNKVNITVTAKDGVEKVVYTLEFVVPLSSVATLDKIFLDGEVVSNFSPNEFYYYVELPIGVTTLPDLVVQKHETAQTTQITAATVSSMRSTINVTAEDGISKATYTIVYAFRVSDYDRLQMIYLDGDTLSYTRDEAKLVFDKEETNYILTLPVGTTVFPDVTWEKGDEWQTVDVTTISQTTMRKIQQVSVTAASGKQRVYTLDFEVEQSADTELAMIYVDDYKLSGFDAGETEYFYTVAAGTTKLPKVDYEAGDEYQIISMDTLVDVIANTKSLGQKVHIEVLAQNNSRRTYILHFPIALSENTGLSMIWNNSQPLTSFSKELYDYTVSIPYNEEGLRLMPAITVTKAEEAQNVDIQPQGDSLLLISVMAEDAIHTAIYTISFNYGKSPETALKGLNIDGTPLEGFAADSTEYVLHRFPDEAIPAVEWLPLVEGQSLSLLGPIESADDKGIKTVMFSCDVTSPDEDHFRSYVLHVVYDKTAADTLPVSSRLMSLLVKGEPITVDNGYDYDFHADTLRYVLAAYPAASDNAVFFTPEDITYTTEDPLATVITDMADRLLTTDTLGFDEAGEPVFRIAERSISLIVTDRNGMQPRQYVIRQSLTLSHDSTVTMIMLDGNPYLQFDPEQHDYIYYISAGTTPPEVSFEVADSTAYKAEVVADEYKDGDKTVLTRTIICQSQYAYAFERSNTELRNTYVIRFVESDINEADMPTANDLLVKHIAGSTQIAVASLRSGVKFALYDAAGATFRVVELTPQQPSNLITATDANGTLLLVDIYDISQAEVLTLEYNVIYYYCFFDADNRRVKSGKLQIVR